MYTNTKTLILCNYIFVVRPVKMMAEQGKKSQSYRRKKVLIVEHRTISRVLKLFYVIFTCSFTKAIMKRSFKSRVNSAGNFIHSAESWKATRKGQNPQKCLFWVLSFLLK